MPGGLLRHPRLFLAPAPPGVVGASAATGHRRAEAPGRTVLLGVGQVEP